MHAHAFHKGERADQNDVAGDLRADSSRVIKPMGGSFVMLAILRLQKRFKQLRQRTSGCLQRGQSICDDLGRGMGAVELHAVGCNVAGGKQVAVAQDNGVAPAEDLRAVPAAEPAMDIGQALCQRGKGRGEGEQRGAGRGSEQKQHPAVQEGCVTAAVKKKSGGQRCRQQNG